MLAIVYNKTIEKEHKPTGQQEETKMTVTTSKGTITAKKELLNYISMMASYAADDYKKRGRDALAEEAEKFSEEIYEILKASGLYD